MANTCNILGTFTITFLTFLSLSSALIKSDIPEDFERHFNHELQPFLREKRQEDVSDFFPVKEHDPIKLEELSGSQTVHDRRAIGEKVKEIDQDDGKDKEQEKSSDTEEDAQNNAFSYKNMHDLIQALILADEEDIAERLQQLRELENATKSETLSNLPKRHAIASAAATAAAATSNSLLGANLWDAIPVTDLDAHSCEVEAFGFGHLHLSGTIVHEFFCELRKLWHYVLIIVRNFKSELTLGPLIAGEVVAGGLFHHIPHLLHAVIREPHHLLILPDIIRDAIPLPSITGAIFRLKYVFFKVVHFVFELVHDHIRHILGHFFLHHRLGIHLREKLLAIKLAKLHYLQGFGSIIPVNSILPGIIAEPAISTASAATATATATATASASSDETVFVPDYQRSLAEVLSSFRGIYDGYYASGIPHLIRTGARSFSTSSVISGITSYLPRIPFLNYFGCGPIGSDTTVTATSTSSAATSVGVDSVGPIVSPIVGPIIGSTVVPVAPVISSESATSSATATATATSTVTETKPIVSAAPLISAIPTVVPSVVPSESTSSVSSSAATAAAAAAAAATATAVTAASPVVSSYRTAPRVSIPAVVPSATSAVSASSSISATNTVVEEAVPYAPLIQPVPTLSPIVSETFENTVSESSSVAVAAPEVAVSDTLESTVATASASASASSAADVVSAPVVGAVPVILPLIRPSPILSTVTPVAASASASSSASTSSVADVVSAPVLGSVPISLPLIRPRPILSTVAPSAASASASSSASISSTSDVASAPVVSSVPVTLPLRYRPRPILSTVAPATASASASSSASVSSGNTLEPGLYRGLDLNVDRLGYPLIRSRILPAVTPSAAVSSAAASASSSSATASSAASVVSSSGLNFILPREQIIGALGHDYLSVGDIVTVTLRNKAILFGRVLDATSPITFNFLRPKLRTSLFRHGGRVWNLLPRDFRDPDCIQKFNSPLLLRYAL